MKLPRLGFSQRIDRIENVRGVNSKLAKFVYFPKDRD